MVSEATTMRPIANPDAAAKRRPISNLPPAPLSGTRCDRFDSEERAECFISQKIQQTSGALTHFANPLLELRQHRLAPCRQAALVQYDHLQLLPDQPANEDVALPLRELVAGVERHARYRDRWRPE